MEADWIWGLIGGLIIGMAGAVYLLGNGRIMGPSSVVGGILDGSDRSGEQFGFLAGLVALPALIVLALPAATYAPSNLVQLVLGGLLVGFGTRLANGCTSGHGVCGISRLSPRGVVASAVYIGAGMATMALARTIWGLI